MEVDSGCKSINVMINSKFIYAINNNFISTKNKTFKKAKMKLFDYITWLQELWVLNANKSKRKVV